MQITVVGGTMSEAEQQEYANYLRKKHPGYNFTSLTLTIDGEYVDMKYEYDMLPFQRIRRITGYLVGTLDRFNNAKRTEVNDRLPHSSCGCDIEPVMQEMYADEYAAVSAAVGL